MCVGQMEDRRFFLKLSFQCVVFDEAHMLKNMASQRFCRLMKIEVLVRNS